MSSPGVAASRSTSSMSEASSWYSKRLPDRYSESIATIFSGSRMSAIGGHLRYGAILRQIVHRVLQMPIEHRLDLLERVRLGDARDVLGAGQRNARHRRRLDRKGRQALRLQAVHLRLPARAREHLHLERERVQEVLDAPRGLVDV